MKFETKIAKLGIQEEVKKILTEAEKGGIYDPAKDEPRIEELSKIRNWKIAEYIENYFEGIDKDGNEVEHTGSYYYCNLNSLCETYGFDRNRLAEFYAKAIAEYGYSLAYDINEDIILIIDGVD